MKHDALLLLVFEVVIRLLRSSPLQLSCIYTRREVAAYLRGIGALE